MAKDYTQRLDETIKGNIDQDTLNQLIQITITHTGPEVTWDHLEAYLASKIPADDALFDNLHALIFSAFQDSETSEDSVDNALFKLTFNDSQTAQAFFAFTQHAFPIINSEYPKISHNEITLTEDQHFFCRRGAKLKNGMLPSDFLTEYFIKTLRADEYDFSDKFIKGIIPTPNGTRRLQNLRPKKRQNFTIAADGTVISRTAKAASLTTMNDSFTQIQSCTFLGPIALPTPFGFDKSRTPKLYGILTHIKDLMINRLLLNDGGTVSRPFDFEAETLAAHRSSELRKPDNTVLYSNNEFEKFKDENINIRRKQKNTNEVLARKRFNIFRGMICICANNLEARLLAKDFSEEMLEYYADYAKSKGYQLNPKFKLPILFYIKNSPATEPTNPSDVSKKEPVHDMFRYTGSMQADDLKKADEIYNDFDSRNASFSNNNFEFLLGLKIITPEMLLEPVQNGTPLAIQMMRQGYTRMLLRLLRPSRENNACHSQESFSLIAVVFDSLVAYKYIIQDDTIISHLILAEAFDLASNLISITKSTIDNLVVEEIHGKLVKKHKLIDYSIQNGNPRVIQYLGLEETLKKAAYHNHWTTVRLCLKELSNISQDTIDYLFFLACDRKDRSEEPDVVYLLKRKGVSPASVEKEFIKALEKHRWNLVELLITYYENHSKLLLGFALLEVLRNNQVKLAGLILQKGASADWRINYGQKYFLSSALLYGIQHDAKELFPQLLEHESNYHDEYSDARYQLAVDLAKYKNTELATNLLIVKNKPSKLIDPNSIKLSVCHLVFEAFFANQPDIAEYRLNHYGRQHKLLLANHKNIISSLHYFSEVFESTLLHFKHLLSYSEPTYINAFFECLLDLSMKHKDISLLKLLQTLMHEKLGIDKSTTEELLVNLALRKLSSNNTNIITALINTSKFLHYWKLYLTQKFRSVTSPQFTDNDQANTVYSLLSVIKRLDSTFIVEDIIHDNAKIPVYDMLIESAKRNDWTTIRPYLNDGIIISRKILTTLLSLAIEQNLQTEITMLLNLGADNEPLNSAIRHATYSKPIDWATIELYLKLHPKLETCPEFGRALLFSLRYNKVILARTLFNVVKSQKWRHNDFGKIQLQSTLLYVIKNDLNDLLVPSYLHETSYHDDHSERRLRLALDFAILRKNKSAIELLQDKVNPNPLSDPQDTVKSVCLLVFEAYFLSERELAEWRLFHYGWQFNVIPKDCKNIVYGLKILLTGYEKALPYLSLTFRGEDVKYITKLFLFYGDAALFQSFRALTESVTKSCGCCTEKVYANKLLDSATLQPIQSLKELISYSQHLGIWLLTLKDKLSTLNTEDLINNNKHIEALLDIGVFVLDQINQHKTTYLNEYFKADIIKVSVSEMLSFINSIKHNRKVCSISPLNFFMFRKRSVISELNKRLIETSQLFNKSEPNNSQKLKTEFEPKSPRQ